MKQVCTGEKLVLKGVSRIVLASGYTPEVSEKEIDEMLKQHPNVVWARPYGTVVEAVSSGKSAAELFITQKG